MTLGSRRYLYIFFILAFLIITPLVILYANGYQLSFDQSQLVKTGMLVLDSKPSGAEVFLNNQPQKTFINQILNQSSYITTPAKIKNLLPGEYFVKIERDGYWPWQKKLSVNPGQSTYAENILLFKNSTSNKIVDGPIKNFYPSPDKNYLIAVGSKNSYLYNLNSNDLKIIEQVAKGVMWSNDSKKFIISPRVYDVNNLSAPYDFSNSIKPSLQDVFWDYQDNNKLFLTTSKNDLFLVDMSSNEVVKMNYNSGSISDLLVKDNQMYLIARNKEKISLNVINLSSQKLVQTINLPDFSSLHFINIDNKLLNIYDSKNKNLYLIDPFGYSPVKAVINNLVGASWVNANRLLYYNDFEIYTFDLGTLKSSLLTRISEPVKNLFWHPSDNYIIYTTNKKIISLELDDREKRNSIDLLTSSTIESAYLNKKGDVIYFNGEVDGQKGLFQLAIQ